VKFKLDENLKNDHPPDVTLLHGPDGSNFYSDSVAHRGNPVASWRSRAASRRMMRRLPR